MGSNFSYYSFDIKSEENWKNFRDNLLEKGIIPDILINNAGILPRFSRFEKYTDREIEDVLRINFLSAVYAVRTLLPADGAVKDARRHQYLFFPQLWLRSSGIPSIRRAKPR